MTYEYAMEGDLDYLKNLKEENSDDLQKEVTPFKDTILHVATEFHQTEFAKMAVQFCPPLLLLVNSLGNTALHIAAGEGHKDLVEFFIGYMKSSDIETGEYKDLSRMVNWKNDTALHCAARAGSQECVKLLAEADPTVCSFVNDNGESPLYLLVASGSWKKPGVIIDMNLASSASASYKGPKGLTALHASVLFNLHGGYGVEEIGLLARWRREMIREGDDLGMTPLHYAAFYRIPRGVELFVEYDSSAIYVLNNDGESPLHLAAFSGCIRTLKRLLLFLDCYNMVDKKGRTALHAAVLGEQKEAVEFILNTPILVRSLINKADNDGNTPLHLAAYFRFIHIIQTISNNKKVRFDILNNEFLTPVQVYMQHIPESIKELYIGNYVLKEGNIVMATHERANTQLKRTRKEAKTNARKEITSTNNNNQNDLEIEMKRELEVNLLVATLVATVTFTAGFTLPGGLVSNGEDEGLATFTNKPAFKAFVVFNSLAFYCSIFVVGFHFINSTVDNNFTRLGYKATVKPFTGYSVLAMLLAFCCGTYLMLTKSTGLAMVPFIISAFFMSILLLHIRPSYFLIRAMTMVQHLIYELNKRIKIFLLHLFQIIIVDFVLYRIFLLINFFD